MRHAALGTALAILAAVLGAVATFYVSVWHLSRPDTLLGWLVQGCAGVTVGVIVFFVVWGHFHDPEAGAPTAS